MANIFSQNAAWVASKKSIHGPDFFKNQIANHHPTYLWIGCSDARVPANEIMGEDTGSVFVVRNVANMVIGTDFNAMSAIQFAVDYLEVPHIIVCGHYDCGGVRASTSTSTTSPLSKIGCGAFATFTASTRKSWTKLKTRRNVIGDWWS